MKWTLILLGLLMAGVIALAIAGVGKKAKRAPNANRAKAAASLSSSPTALGKTARVGGGWTLRIISVDWNAESKIAAVSGQYGQKPPAAAREVMLLAVVRYNGAGQAFTKGDFGDRVFAVGSHAAPYKWDSGLNACGEGQSKLPAPDTIQPLVEQDTTVFSGTTLRGHMCFEVAANDVRSLRVYVMAHASYTGKPSPYSPKEPSPVWFALR